MADQVRIREANEGDVLGMIELWTELMDFHGQLDSIFTVRAQADERFAEFVRGNIASNDACVLVAEQNGSLLGYCQAIISEYPPVLQMERYGHIQDLTVRQQFRRRGIGSGLVEAAREWILNKGMHRIEVRYSAKNAIAEAFWKNTGFEPYLTTSFQEI